MSPLLVVMLQIPIKSYVVPTMLMELSLSLGALTLMQGYFFVFFCFFFFEDETLEK